MAIQPPESGPSPLLSPLRPRADKADQRHQRQLDIAARLAATLLRAPMARLYVPEPRGLTPIAGSPELSSGEEENDPGTPVATEILRTGGAVLRPVRILASEGPPGIARTSSGNQREEGRVWVGVPVVSGTREWLGALLVADAPERSWGEDDLARLRELAELISPMLIRTSETSAGSTAHTSAWTEPEEGTAAPQARARSRTRATVPSPPRAAELFSEAGDAALVEIIRESIVGSLHLGALKAGDRLPSIRQTARAFSVTPYMVLQAYAELELEGLVERRERSGIFVADFEEGAATSLPETGAWLTEVLTQACQHQVKIPLLPDLIRRWTDGRRLRCACVEPCFDSRFALSMELSQQFGIQATAVSPNIAGVDLGQTDLVITTAYQASEIGPLVAEAGTPMLIATVNPLILSSALNHLRERDLTVVCVDRVYGERLRALQGGAYRDRVRVVTTDDSAGLVALDRSEAILLTPAARQRLAQPDFRLVAPVYPAYSIDFARKVAEALVRINLVGTYA